MCWLSALLLALLFQTPQPVAGSGNSSPSTPAQDPPPVEETVVVTATQTILQEGGVYEDFRYVDRMPEPCPLKHGDYRALDVYETPVIDPTWPPRPPPEPPLVPPYRPPGE